MENCLPRLLFVVPMRNVSWKLTYLQHVVTLVFRKILHITGHSTYRTKYVACDKDSLIDQTLLRLP